MLNLGYLGGVYDAGSGLIYMGNGQYYDPSTGRFLTRGAKQDQSNPYTPWNSDPAGMLIAPLALLALVFGRKKTRTKFDQFIILFVIVLSVGLSVSACSGSDTPTVEPGTEIQIVTPEGTATIIVSSTKVKNIPESTSAPTATINPYACEFDTVLPWQQMLEKFRITKDEISMAGSMENYLRNEVNENPALTLVRTTIGETSNKAERIRIMWLIMIKKILGFNNSNTRNQLGTNIWDHYGLESTFEIELLEPNSEGAYQFEDLHGAFEVFDPEQLSEGISKYMFYPDESMICDYLELYEYALQITKETKETIKINSDPYLQQIKGYDSYLAYFYEAENNNFNPNDPKTTWGADSKRTNFAEDNPDKSLYNQLNVWRDNYPMDNVFFGLVSCEIEKQVVDSWWQAYGTENYFANLFHESDVENVSCP